MPEGVLNGKGVQEVRFIFTFTTCDMDDMDAQAMGSPERRAIVASTDVIWMTYPRIRQPKGEPATSAEFELVSGSKRLEGSAVEGSLCCYSTSHTYFSTVNTWSARPLISSSALSSISSRLTRMRRRT